MPDAIQASAVRHAERLAPFIADVSLLVNEALDRGECVLCEGAQGTLLDLDHGTYPFVTSSNPIAGAACVGLGMGPTRIGAVAGVAKAYLTRVGEGPFPSEAGPAAAEALREAGGEFGTVTGRPRRCGWLDLVGLRYAARVNGFTELVLTKLDVLSAVEEIPVCVAYRLRDGSVSEHFPAHQSDFHHAEPVWETLEGWGEPIERARRFADLPLGGAALRGVRRRAPGRAGRARQRRPAARSGADGRGLHGCGTRARLDIGREGCAHALRHGSRDRQRPPVDLADGHDLGARARQEELVGGPGVGGRERRLDALDALLAEQPHDQRPGDARKRAARHGRREHAAAR